MRTEILAGVTTFITMAYILAVNPSVLSSCGMDAQAVLMATALSAFAGTMCMALMADYPFALAPGMGLNAFFAVTVCSQMGYPWQTALLAVFVEGLVFLVLTLTGVCDLVFKVFPAALRKSIAVGIGLFLAFTGLQNAHVIVASPGSLVRLIDFNDNFGNSSLAALLALAGLLLITVLHIKSVKGALLIGVAATWLLGVICQLGGIYTVDPAHGFYSLLPVWSEFAPGSIGKVIGQCFTPKAVSAFNLPDFCVITLSFLIVNVFDSCGSLTGVAGQAGMLDEEGRLPRMKQALSAGALAAASGAVLGTSTSTVYVESAA